MTIALHFNRLAIVLLIAFAWLALPQLAAMPAMAQEKPAKMLYLVEGTGGPGFKSPQEAVEVLQKAILPGFDHIMKLQAQGKILAGGLPIGDRAFVFIMEAASNDEADQLVRGLPFWGALQWKVTPLQSVAGRAAIERKVVEETKGKQ